GAASRLPFPAGVGPRALNPFGLTGAAVEPGALGIDGGVWGGSMELALREHPRHVKLVNMPATTDLEKPLPRRRLIRLQGDVGDSLAPREDRVEARRSRKAEVGAHADTMEVPVDESRQHAAAVQVNHLRSLFR